MRILGIETSCDETAAAVLEFSSPSTQAPSRRSLWSGNIDVKILSNVVHSQIATHRKTGGVVPEVAAREHVEKIIPVVEKALVSAGRKSEIRNPKSETNTKYKILNTKPPIDAIAVTYGPGLITSLMVGVETARTLAWAWKIPLVAVNHMEGHIAAAWLQRKGIGFRVQGLGVKTDPNPHTLTPIPYPALALVVSGGHTELVLMKKPLGYKIIGATRDDAVGEAFDKVAKILGLEYPGGPVVSRLAESGDPTVFPFSAPMIKSNDYDFSFSGIKTAVLYKVKELEIRKLAGRVTTLQAKSYKLTPVVVADICASFQKAVVDVLVAKTIRAAKEYKIKTVILAGGVAANKQLREQLAAAVARELPITNYQLPIPSFCTDNAVMIAIAGYFHALKKQFTPWKKLDVNPNLVLGVDRIH
ncbi:tRNA (adenosine(37)-N6)-threonylcarbamoyltransferase complex transferase subunit TsaD [Candidatus Uhrbacteria bacterium]|nr:tRNA (adenosine(37)-N6)-threonylcarbamoyltransferase complex transferase subunit TsaD [Candidatus Uhrbacteria bacterium]